MCDASTILVIDNDRDVADGAARWLIAAGHNVIVTHNGREGLRLAAVERPDVILLDPRMPPVNGRTILSRLRDQRQTAIIPLVMFATHRRATLSQRLPKLGVRFSIAKPYEASCLLATVSAALGRPTPDQKTVARDDVWQRKRIDTQTDHAHTYAPKNVPVSTGTDVAGVIPPPPASLRRRHFAGPMTSYRQITTE